MNKYIMIKNCPIVDMLGNGHLTKRDTLTWNSTDCLKTLDKENLWITNKNNEDFSKVDNDTYCLDCYLNLPLFIKFTLY